MYLIILGAAASAAGYWLIGMALPYALMIGMVAMICALLGEVRQLTKALKKSYTRERITKLECEAAELFYWNCPAEMRLKWNSGGFNAGANKQRENIRNALIELKRELESL
ncbi:hypothetical protein L8R85_02195 [Vibrio splendidus]|nr:MULTISPECIES: hypothetical protein [Vibrio]MDH5919827.1 hypothetical protein [Vibrio splendidus]TCN05638.1 hypothetical protein EDB35_116136 [Vibrio crassostreae]TCT46144.1 hypothetical protein EDB39_11416 [Vibrio crassostreae]TCT54249.1 hypothetical protein EDB40_114136 [Vibrio crassostreae]TCT58884.1 hypothetical protein EDB44_11819 [Vibrio crassostreae]